MAQDPEEMKAWARATYNAAAQHFDDPPLAFWEHFGGRTVELAGIGPGHTVLDVCCGSGASALQAAERSGPGGRVVGVDFADDLLELARTKAKQRTLTNVSFRNGDMTSLQFAGESFDFVVCVFGIFFASDMSSALAGLWDKVKPGGALMITVWGPRVLEPGNTVFWDAVEAERPDLRMRSAPWLRLESPEGLVGLFAEASLPPPEIVSETHSSYLSADDYWTVVLGSGYRGAIDRMSHDAAERVRAAVVQRLERVSSGEFVSDVLYARAVKS
jgi:SAM-dependent methyltransferase